MSFTGIFRSPFVAARHLLTRRTALIQTISQFASPNPITFSRRLWRHYQLNAHLLDLGHQVALREEQQEEPEDVIRDRMEAFPLKPTFSIIMPAYNPPLDFLQLAIDSIRSQPYENWEICIADDKSPDKNVRPFLEQLMSSDSRIKVIFREQNGHISAASNSAITLASGDFLVLVDQDDELSKNAFYELLREINEYPDVDLIYSDEDKLTPDGRRFLPFLKPDWNYEQFLSRNMFSHLGVYRTELVHQVDGFRIGYEGSQDYDLALRCIERTTPDKIRHIPKVLYHWRAIPGSTSMEPESKSYAFVAGQKSLEDHLQRVGTPGTVETTSSPGAYRIHFQVPESHPTVTVLHYSISSSVPRTEVRASYDSYQTETVESSSTTIGHDLNTAIKSSKSDLICLIRTDCRPENDDWLSELVAIVSRPGVGVVGAKLIHKSGEVRHGGYFVSDTRIGYGDPLVGILNGIPGPDGMCDDMREVAATSGLCMIFSRKAFELTGGFSELPEHQTFFDVDFCLNVNGLDLRNIWTPAVQCLLTSPWHAFSKTLEGGSIDWNTRQTFVNLWGNRLPKKWYWSPHYCHEHCDFRLAAK